jgi:hypothetical protein
MAMTRKTMAVVMTLVAGLSASGMVQAAGVSGQGTWEWTLWGRNLDGHPSTYEAYYDTVLKVTWLANANAGAGSIYDNGYSKSDGRMTWGNAAAWAGALSFTVGGTTYDDWRLPFVVDTHAPGCNFGWSGTDCGYNVQTESGGTVYSELAHMFYDTLGNKAFGDTSVSGAQSGWGLTNTGPFSGLQSYYFWSGTEYAPYTGYAWDFYTYDGFQDFNDKISQFYAWAVRPGDVAAAVVPLPAGLPMLLTALASFGLLGLRRRR